MTMPRTRKKTRSMSSLAEALKVCRRILRPEEWRVSLNSRRMRMMLKNSKTSAFLMSLTNCCRQRSLSAPPASCPAWRGHLAGCGSPRVPASSCLAPTSGCAPAAAAAAAADLPVDQAAVARGAALPGPPRWPGRALRSRRRQRRLRRRRRCG